MIVWWLGALAMAQSVSVQTARIDLPAGHVLRARDLTEVSVPERGLPMGTVTDAQTVEGRTVKVPLFAGEMVRGEYLGPPQTVPDSLIPEGHWLLPAEVRTQSDQPDLVKLMPGGFCVVARGVTVVLADAGWVAVAASDVPRAVAAMRADASVRRADPGMRDCR